VNDKICDENDSEKSTLFLAGKASALCKPESLELLATIHFPPPNHLKLENSFLS
jgi:hypothetical protein